MRRKRAYHHGNLKEALLEAALRLISETGPAGFTLREAARKAGVSHNAPYRHFQSKDELLAAVATEGFKQLTRGMMQRAERGTDAWERLLESGLAYVEFALERPAHFTVMFEGQFEIVSYPECASAGREAFQTLVGFVEECQGAGFLPPGESLTPTLVAWSLVHGIAKLAVAGRLPQRTKQEILGFTATAIQTKSWGAPRRFSPLSRAPEGSAEAP